MRSIFYVLLLSASGCALFAPAPAAAPKAAEDAPLVSVAPQPSWVGLESFAISSTITAGVGVEKLDATDPCWSSGVLLAAVRNRALAALAKTFDLAPDSEAAIAELKGAEVKLGWYDGRHTLYALATIERPSNLQARAQAQAHSPSGGVPILQLAAVLKDAGRANLDKHGVCRDPYKRLDVKCCGGPATFCSDKTRFERSLPGGKCACGDGPPCHQDFVCEERQGSKKCICRGPSCPCEVRNCPVGQTCGDGRCY